MRPTSMTRGHAAAARIAYGLVIVIATLSNLHFEPNTADVAFRLHRAFTVHPHMADVVDAARNILLFAGLGAVWVATSRLTSPWVTVLRVTIIGFLGSACVETLQLFSPVRQSSILDVTTNTVGTLLGALGTLGAFTALDARLGKRSYVGIPAFIFAACYGIATLMEAFIPLFRQDLLPNLGGGVGERIARGWAALRPESIAWIPRIDFLIVVPAGIFAVAALAELGVTYGTAWPAVTIGGAALFLVLEIVHTVASEPIILGAALTHIIAVAAGAAFAAWALPRFTVRFRGAARPRLVLLAYAIIIMLWSWRPFRLELTPSAMAEQFAPEHLVPLMALASRMDLFSVTDVIAQFLLFVPLGALLAVWPLRRRGPFRTLLPALYLSVVLELGKIVVAERFLDTTHILIQSAGAAIGYALVHHSAYRPYGEVLAPD